MVCPVASIRVRTRKDGSESFTLLWREDGRQCGEVFETRKDAEMWKRLLDDNGQSFGRAKKVRDASIAEGPTVTEALTEHIDLLVGTTEYTIKRYRDGVRLHFAPSHIGRMKVKNLTHDAIVEWIKWMQGRDKGPKTIALQHGLLSAAMETCVRQGVMERNPCKGVRLPKQVRVGDDGDDITMDDFKAIRDRIDPFFHPFLDFLVGTGCRFSEATPLMASDFTLNIPTPLVFISKAHKLAAAGGRYVGETKTRKSRRKVSLAPSTVESIRPLVEAAAADGGLVFRMKGGGEFTAQAFYNKAWEQARRQAGLGVGSAKHVTVHSLRHLHAALLLEAGMNMYDLSRRLGHENIAVSVDRYSHLLPDAHFVGMNIAHKALGGLPLVGELDDVS